METKQAYFGGGCFWCTEAAFRLLKGVINVNSGYGGVTFDNPKYELVSSGKTGHAEMIKVEYDPSIITYIDLLKYFFKIHNPTTPNRQGRDIGSQYRSIILFNNVDEENKIRSYISELEREGIWENIVTEVRPLDKFWPAEEKHQRYFEKNPDLAYCEVVISPKISKLKEEIENDQKSI